MAKIDTKNLVLHGVGEAFLLSGDGKVSAKLGSLQDMTIDCDYGRCIWRRRFVPDL